METSKKDHDALKVDVEAKISNEISSLAEKSENELDVRDSRHSSEIGKISLRVDSLERLNSDLEQALKKLALG